MSQLPSSSCIRVALVEDDVNFQNALADAIHDSTDMQLVCLAGTHKLGLEMLDGTGCDVLLVDLGLPDGSGIDVIRAARVKWPACNIMVSTTFGDETHVMQSLEAGAAGYLLKDSTPEKMVFEIRSLYAGGSPISPMIARQILMRFRLDEKNTAGSALWKAGASVDRRSKALPDQPATDRNGGEISNNGSSLSVLSPREMEVLEFITKGFTSDEIAGLMSVSRHTVLTFVRRIYAKLAVKSKAEAIYEARKQGLLS